MHFDKPGRKCPDGAKSLLLDIFQWEPHRTRTFEILEHPWLSSNNPEIADMKKSNAIGRFNHERAEEIRDEPLRLLNVRRRMFRHFKLFREDYLRQPQVQQAEITRLEGVLSNSKRFLGPRPYGLFEIKGNVQELQKEERLYKEEYWPRLYKFSPMKCQYLGINRTYCKARQAPVVSNLNRLANKDIPSYGLPPPRRGNGDDKHALEISNASIFQ